MHNSLLVAPLEITWPLLSDDFLLPDEPVENIDQPLLASALRQSLTSQSALWENALIVSNFAICAAINDRIICKAPDWMYAAPVQSWTSDVSRRSYTPHTEGAIPQVVMEFLSATYGEEYSVEFTEKVGKWFFYEQVIKVPRYVIFRPHTGSLEVYGLESGKYQLQDADEQGRYLIPGLDLFLGVWQGSHEGRDGYWLRWWNAQGELLLWPEEQVEQTQAALEAQKQRNEQLKERLLQMGIDPEQI